MRRNGAITKGFRKYITPAVDIYETLDSYVLFLDMPGVKKEDLSVKLLNDSLIVHGKFSIQAREEDEILLNEIDRGEYHREFVIASDVDKDKIEAKLIDGVLILTLRKKDENEDFTVKIN